jgi:hypothetical protein
VLIHYESVDPLRTFCPNTTKDLTVAPLTYEIDEVFFPRIDGCQILSNHNMFCPRRRRDRHNFKFRVANRSIFHHHSTFAASLYDLYGEPLIATCPQNGGGDSSTKEKKKMID